MVYFIDICSFFFFKQKTAYDMRISDWSSDVCSSDLEGPLRNGFRTCQKPAPLLSRASLAPGTSTSGRRHQRSLQLSPVPATPYFEQLSIGAGRRTLAISLALLITAVLLVMLLYFGPGKRPETKEERVIVGSLGSEARRRGDASG